MKRKLKSLVFFGNERLATGLRAVPSLLPALIDNGYQVTAVVVNYEAPNSRVSRQLEIASVAQKNSIPLLKDLNKATAIIKKSRPAIGILVAYGRLVPQEIIDLFPLGIINLHPSLLPKYRGPTPIEQAILDGSLKTGVSIMRLAKEMDAGPVFAQAQLDLSGAESKQQLADKLLKLGSDLLVETLPSILNKSTEAVEQDNSRATYSRLLTKSDGRIDWHKSAKQIEREVRAYLGWPGSYTTLGQHELQITKAHATDDLFSGLSAGVGQAFQTLSKGLAVSTGKGVLIVAKLKPAGKKEMTAEAFLAGYGSKLR